MKSVVALAFIVTCFSAGAQTLSLNDIIEVRKMDSTQLEMFSEEKGFQLKKFESDAWRTVVEYQFKSDSSVKIIKTIPAGKTLLSDANPGMVHYYFSDKSAVKDFKKELKEKKFKYHKGDSTQHAGVLFIHNKYRLNADEIDLASQQTPDGKVSYALMYYRRPN